MGVRHRGTTLGQSSPPLLPPSYAGLGLWYDPFDEGDPPSNKGSGSFPALVETGTVSLSSADGVTGHKSWLTGGVSGRNYLGADAAEMHATSDPCTMAWLVRPQGYGGVTSQPISRFTRVGGTNDEARFDIYWPNNNNTAWTPRFTIAAVIDLALNSPYLTTYSGEVWLVYLKLPSMGVSGSVEIGARKLAAGTSWSSNSTTQSITRFQKRHVMFDNLGVCWQYVTQKMVWPSTSVSRDGIFDYFQERYAF